MQGNYVLSLNAPDYETPITYLDILGKDPRCPVELQCVSYVKSKMYLPPGNANQIPITSKIPVVGGAILFYSNPYGHIAYVERVFGDMIFISEQNQIGCGAISFRWISVNTSTIKGYFNP